MKTEQQHIDCTARQEFGNFRTSTAFVAIWQTASRAAARSSSASAATARPAESVLGPELGSQSGLAAGAPTGALA